jgi:hypothetical protein
MAEQHSIFHEGGQIMSKQLLCLISFVLVLGMTAVSPAGLDDDPNLVGYWKFDGDTLDSSPNGRDGTLAGDAHLVDVGVWNGALAVDGSGDYVNIDGYKGINADRSDPNNTVQQAFSIACWMKTDRDGEMVTWGTLSGRQKQTFRVEGGRLRTEHHAGNLRGNIYVNDSQWHHVALTVSEGAILRPEVTKLYTDGVEETYRNGSDNPYELLAGSDVRIGMSGPHNGRYFNGMLDEVYIFDRVLDPNEIAELARRPKSHAPDPAGGALVEEVSYLLNWTPGDFAAEHDVYIGTTPDLGPDQLLGRQAAGPILATGLEKDTTYYWRVDDVAADGTTFSTGDTWSFWVPPRSAYDPSIEDGKAILDLTVNLTWTGGWTPIMHQTYFGTDRDQVAAAAGAPLVMDIGLDPGQLEPGTTYYWRVDEFYGTDTVAAPVWSFSTVPDIPLTAEPNLVADWTMDEAAGDVVLDMSGNANHALVMGGAQVVDGAMEFDGIVGSILEVPDASLGIFDPNGSEFTAVLSVNPSRLLPNTTNHNISNVVLSRASDPFNDNFELGISVEGDAMIYTDTDAGDSTRVVGDGEITVGDWHQIVAVYDANAVDIYVDGIRYSTQVTGVFFDQAAGSQFTIGDSGHEENPYGGLIDDVKVYDRAMTPDEVRQAYLDLALAYDPDPAAGSADVDVLSALSWLAGDAAAEHDVYLGADKAAVAAADASSDLYRGRQADTSYALGILDFETKLYWRVDEVAADGAVWKGNVWRLDHL